MAASDYTGSNTLWTTIKRLAAGDFLTAALLYDACIVKLQDNTRWAAARLRALFGEAIVITANSTTDTFSATGHALENGTPGRVASSGSLPTGLSADTVYYVVNKTEDTFQLSATLGGAAVNITTAGSGVIGFEVDGSYAIATVPSGTLLGYTLRAQLDNLRDKAGRVGTRVQAQNFSSLSGNWSQSTYGKWINTALGGLLEGELDLPHGQTLTGITARWAPAPAHGGVPTMPVLTLYKVDRDGTQTSLGSQTDTNSGSVGAYETAHDIAITGLTHTIDRESYRYQFTLSGETGGNFVANAACGSVKATVA